MLTQVRLQKVVPVSSRPIWLSLFQGVDDDSFTGMQSKSMAPTGLNSVSL